jgi:serine protease Do
LIRWNAMPRLLYQPGPISTRTRGGRAEYLAGLLPALALLAVLALADRAAAQEPSGLQTAVALEKLLTDTIARTEKSVVAIARVRKDQPGENFRLEFRPDPFGRRTGPAAPPQPGDPDFLPNEYGAGVVIDRRGLVLTAYHVLGEDSEYFVTTTDHRVYRATIKAADPRSDLAVLAIEGSDVASTNLAPIQFGDAAALRKGQIVLTLGNPYAIARDGQPSAGWGIVANLARKAPPESPDPAGKRTLHHFGTLIQTDAKLNLGASGGPLLNLKGEMVGLCVSLAAMAGYETSAGYAIPVDPTFRRVIDVLKQGREVEYGLLGVLPINLQPQERMTGLQGTRVDRVEPGTPAARFGLRPDDIITAVENTPIYDADGLVLEVGKLPVEAAAHLTVIRSGRKRTVEVTLGKYPVRGRKIVTVRPDAWRGLRVDYASAYTDPDQAVRSGVMFGDDAVVVTEVDPNTPAAQAGLKRGMLISLVDGKPVRTPKEFQAAIAEKAGAVQVKLATTERNAVITIPAGS